MTRLQDFLNSPIPAVSVLRKAAKQGDLFGLELECEGARVDYDGSKDILSDWAPHADGSLRAYHGSACEWVFNGPVKYKASVDRVNKLFDYFEKNRAKLVTSNRTSTHIHYNMGDKNAYQLVNLFILFTLLEDLLDRYCGEDRKGNLFCLSSRHAEEQVRWIENACFKHYSFIFKEDWRYCSLNVASINKFGTVEFRGMRGLDNREDVLSWLSIINEFCDYACYKMKNPVELIESISVKTPLGFLKEVFSNDNFMLLTKGIDEHVINQSVFEGLRLVQMLCYRVGTEFDEVRLKGRDFWASFSDNQEPERDVDPELLMGGAPKAQARPQRGQKVRFVNAGHPDPVAVAPARWDQIVQRYQPVEANFFAGRPDAVQNDAAPRQQWVIPPLERMAQQMDQPNNPAAEQPVGNRAHLLDPAWRVALWERGDAAPEPLNIVDDGEDDEF